MKSSSKQPPEGFETAESAYETYTSSSAYGGGDRSCGERVRAVACDQRAWLVAGIVLIFVLAFGFGFLAGFLVRGSRTSQPDTIVLPLAPQQVMTLTRLFEHFTSLQVLIFCFNSQVTLQIASHRTTTRRWWRL